MRMASSPTFNPTILPTLSPTQADLTPSTLIVGLGTGTFTIIFISAALAIVYCVSEGCGLTSKVCSRCISTILYGCIFLALVFAPRESRYQSSQPVYEIYDHSIPTRIAVCAVVAFFSILSGLILLKQANQRNEVRDFSQSPWSLCMINNSLFFSLYCQLSTIYHDNITFWQNE